MHDVLLIGGSPSSGSTLLVNLLARYDHLLCLPETGIFAHGRNLVGKSVPAPQSEDLSWHLPWINTEAKISNALGWKPGTYEREIEMLPTAFDLLRTHVDPDREYYLVEKTPENVFAFRRYLELSGDRRVVLTSRDALSVVQSMMRRGFTMLESLTIWFSYSYEIAELIRRFPGQVHHCSYESMTHAPDEVAPAILAFAGMEHPRVEFRPQQDKQEAGYLSAIAGFFTTTKDALTLSRTGRDDLRTSMNLLLDIAAWKLEDTCWQRSPAGEVEKSAPVNLIGLDFEVLMNTVVFRTDSGRVVRPTAVEDFLLTGAWPEDDGDALQCEPIAEARFSSAFTKCLASHYAPCRRKG